MAPIPPTPSPRLRRRTLLLLPSIGLLLSSPSCSPHPSPPGLSAADAQSLAIAAVRHAEHAPSLDLEPYSTHPTRAGNYAVLLQRKTSPTTAQHWRVLVHPDRTTEVLPADLFDTTPETLPATPAPLQGDQRQTHPPDPEPVQINPNPHQ